MVKKKRKKKYKFPKMNKTQGLSFIGINIVTFIMLGLEAMNTLFEFDWNQWLMSTLLILISVWLMSQGGMKAMQKLRSKTPQPSGLLHIVSSALGLLTFFIGVLSLPIIGNMLNFSRFAVYVSLVLFAAMVVAILEIFV